MSDDRAAAMVRRIEREARAAGLGEAEAASLARVVEAALAFRQSRLPTDAPDLLHPARTVLILLGDTAERDPAALAAAALLDSRSAGLEPPAESAPPAAAAFAASVPTPSRSGDALAEALLVSDAGILRLALAERLDHARHLHLRPAEEWLPLLESVEEVYLPLAERSEPTLARRLRWWAGMFRRTRADSVGA